MLIESLEFTQWVSSATHNLGHTLDLVLTHGFSITRIDLSNAVLSDHKPIVFTLPLTSYTSRNSTSVRLTRCFTQQSSQDFSEAYFNVPNSLETDSVLDILDTDTHLTLFNSTCAEILNSIAPLRQTCSSALADVLSVNGKKTNYRYHSKF